MKTVLIFLALFYIITIEAQSQTKNFIDQPYIETKAKVDTMVTPDEIYLEININEKELKGNLSLEQQESRMIASIKSIGVDTDDDLKLNDLASYFKGSLFNRKDVLKSKVYSLKLSNAVTAGKVIVELEKINISNISIKEITYSKIEELRISLKSKAILKAKQQAKALTKPIGQKVGAAIYIGEGKTVTRGVSGVRNLYRDQRHTTSYNKKSEPIKFEKIKVESKIVAIFKLE